MSFASDLDAFARKVDGNINLVFRKIVYEIAKDLIAMSPVDTGRFRGNWMIGVGNPNAATTTVNDRSGASTLARLGSQLTTIEAKIPLFVTNSLPYAQRLEYGWSKQAPAGMVRITTARFEQHVNVSVRGLA